MKKTIYKVFKVGRKEDESVYSELHSEEVSMEDAVKIAKDIAEKEGLATKVQPEDVTSH
jgi:hypothetical protein